MNLSELREINEMNGLDMLYKLIEIARSNEYRLEQAIKGNVTAGREVRKSMQDISLMSTVIRDEIQKVQGITKKKYTRNKLEEAIEAAEKKHEKERIMFIFEENGVVYKRKDSLKTLKSIAIKKGLIDG